MPRLLDLFDAFVCMVFQTAPAPQEPPLVIRPEPPPVVIIQAPQEPPKAPKWEDGYVSPPHYGFGVIQYKLGTWKTLAEAKAHAADFRHEMQARDPDVRGYPRSLSWWGIITMVIPDHRDTYSVVLNGVTRSRGDALCVWLSHDGGPYAFNEDGSLWVAWPAWTSRGRGRTCKAWVDSVWSGGRSGVGD